MAPRNLSAGRAPTAAVATRIALVVAAVAALLWVGSPAQAGESEYPNTSGKSEDCLQVPRDLQGVVFRVYCPGKIAWEYSNDVEGCEDGPDEPKYVNRDGVDDLISEGGPVWCVYGAAKELKDWLRDKDNMKDGHPWPENIRDNPCDALPEKHRAGCPNIKKSNYKDLTTHPCMLKNPKTDKPYLSITQQSHCVADNDVFTDGYVPPSRGDDNTYDTRDYSAPPEVMGPLMEGAGWVAWACLVGCFFSAFWCLFQFVGARKNGTEMAHGVMYVAVGTLIVGGASGIAQFVLIY